MINCKTVIALGLCVTSFACFSSKLCGKISSTTTWDGGVFSVVSMDGRTVATTPFILSGNMGCSDSFEPGQYFVRFNGATGNQLFKLGDSLPGCLTTDPYQFSDIEFTIVYNKGMPPFNQGKYCEAK